VEVATAAWVAWWNAQRLHGALGHVPPAEYEAAHRPAPAAAERVSDQQLAAFREALEGLDLGDLGGR
jgi:hypothetical protein